MKRLILPAILLLLFPFSAQATYRINFCREETKKAIPKLIKKLPEGIELDDERREHITSVCPLQY